MTKKTIYILAAIVVILAVAIWIGSMVKAPEDGLPKTAEPAAPAEIVEPGPGKESQPEAGLPPAKIIPPVEPKIEESPLGEYYPEAPTQTMPLAEEKLSEEVIKLTISANGFSPNEFSVNAGQTVSIALTSEDVTHILRFDDPSLENVSISLGRRETRGVSFKAPSQPGNYIFYCEVAGHRERGEAGVMRVK